MAFGARSADTWQQLTPSPEDAMTLGSRMRARVTFDRHELPPAFWFLWMGTVINRLGGFAVPFLMLYLTARLGMSAATAAGVVSALGAGSFLAQLTGGELADRLGAGR